MPKWLLFYQLRPFLWVTSVLCCLTLNFFPSKLLMCIDYLTVMKITCLIWLDVQHKLWKLHSMVWALLQLIIVIFYSYYWTLAYYWATNCWCRYAYLSEKKLTDFLCPLSCSCQKKNWFLSINTIIYRYLVPPSSICICLQSTYSCFTVRWMILAHFTAMWSLFLYIAWFELAFQVQSNSL